MSEFYEGISWLLNGQIQLLFFIVGDKETQYSVSDFKISSNITYIKLFDYREEEPIYPVVESPRVCRRRFNLSHAASFDSV